MNPPRDDDTTADSDNRAVVTRGREVGDIDPETVLRALPRPTVAWSEGSEQVAAGGTAATITANGRDRFETVRRASEVLFAERTVVSDLPSFARPRLFGGFAFHDCNNISNAFPWAGFPGAKFVLPAVFVVSNADRGVTWLVANATGANALDRVGSRLDRWDQQLSTAPFEPPSDRPGIRSRTHVPDEVEWRQQVEDAVNRIEHGSLRKVVLAQAQTVELDTPASIPSVYARLTETYPDCFGFLLAPVDGGQFFGVTPERLVTRKGRTVRTEALAGSIQRGDTSAEDEQLFRKLRESEKEAHEHDLVLEAIRAQLDPYITSVSTGDRTARRLATVQHLQTPVTADLAEDDHILSLVEALHPTPAVGGLPPGAALETIKETETFERGWYASPIGWFDEVGNGTFAVAIRSAVADGQRATLFAGNGIVADSDPDREWDEVRLKYRPILDAIERRA